MAAMNVSPFASLNNPQDCFVPSAPAFTLRLAYSATGSAPLRHVASQVRFARWLARFGGVGKRKYADKTKDHALHGLSFCWIPAATYSPGPLPVKYHRRMKA